MKTKTKTKPAVARLTLTPAQLRAKAVDAIRNEAATKADTVRALYALAAVESLDAAAVQGLYAEAGAPISEGSAKTYAAQFARAFKLAEAGHVLPDLRECATADAVHKAVQAAHDAAGLKAAAGRKADPVKSAESAAKDAKRAATAAENNVKLLTKAAANASDTMKAAMEAAALEAAKRAEALKDEAAKAAAQAEAIKAATPPSIGALKATKPAAASPAERKASRALMQDVAHALAALAARCAADPIARGAMAAALADVEAKARAMVGAIDEATALAARGANN